MFKLKHISYKTTAKLHVWHLNDPVWKYHGGKHINMSLVNLENLWSSKGDIFIILL